MDKFEIWAEGYNATGNSAPARFMGYRYGNSLIEACTSLFEGDPLYKNNRYWGCKLFDNEKDARRSFG